MAKATGTNVTIIGTDKVQVIFRSTGDQDLRPSGGKPVGATGNPKDKNAVVHGSTVGIVIDNPA
jgi:hypothetical protein